MPVESPILEFIVVASLALWKAGEKLFPASMRLGAGSESVDSRNKMQRVSNVIHMGLPVRRTSEIIYDRGRRPLSGKIRRSAFPAALVR